MLQELWICIFIMTVLFRISLPAKNIKLNQSHFIDEYLYLQSKAMHDNTYVDSNFSGIVFNHQGNVNQGKTFYIDQHRYVIHLGSGKIYYE